MSNDAVLFKAFKFYDLYNNGYLSRVDFFKAIAKCGVIIDTHVTLVLSRIFRVSIDTMILKIQAKSITGLSYKNYFSVTTHKPSPIVCRKAK